MGTGVGIGVIGAGVMGADHARLAAGHVRGGHLAAVADADQARARFVAEKYGAALAADAHALIADPEVDAVLVASPDATHAEYVTACLQAGKPVLCEKPMAPTAEAALQLVEAEAAAGRHLIRVGFMRRFDPAYQQMRDALAAGTLGAALLFHCAHRNASSASGFTAVNSVTGAAVHELDIVRWLFDTEVAAVTALQSLAKPGGMQRDPLMLIVETAGGVLVDIEVFVNCVYGYDIRAELVCTEGTMDLKRPAPSEIRHAGQQARAFPPDWRGRFEDAYRLQLNAWVANLGRKDAPGASAWDGYVASAVSAAGVRSLASGEREEVLLAPKPDFYA